MARLLENKTTLTEFAPLSPEEKNSKGFFSRIFGKVKATSDPSVQASHTTWHSDGSNGQSSPQSRDSPQRTISKEQYDELEDASEVFESNKKQAGDSDSANLSDSQGSENFQRRTLSGVLKRLTNIVDRRSQTPQAYKDSDFRQFWMPDSNCKECYECGDKFNTFRRRHHCRICGQIFCSRCCNQEVPGKIMGYTGDLRVCTYCCKVVLSYARTMESTGDLGMLRQDLDKLGKLESEVTGGTSYQELGKRTPTARKRISALFLEEELFRQRSNSVSEILKGNPFDITPQSEYASLENITEERKILTKDSAQLRELWMLVCHPEDGLEMQSHRHRLRTYHNCIVGSTMIDWLIARDKANDRLQAIAIGQALVDARWLECVSNSEQIFKDEFVLYKPGEAANQESPVASVPILEHIEVEEDDMPQWMKELKRNDDDTISLSEVNKVQDVDSESLPVKQQEEAVPRSIFYLNSVDDVVTDTNRRQNRKQYTAMSQADRGSKDEVSPMLQHQDSYLNLTQGLQEAVTSSHNVIKEEGEDMPDGWYGIHELREENGENLAFDRLNKAYKEHLTSLTKQLLSWEGLSLSWTETIMSTSQKVAECVRPNIKEDEDDMDIRQYVQIKKIPGDQKSSTTIFHGAVFTKHVAHRKMSQNMTNPKVLLLKPSLEYQRVENKMSSLDPQILQEHKYLKNLVARIVALGPDIVLVEKTVSRLALEFLLDADITLVSNVKPSVMERVSRFTQSEIVLSIDGLMSRPMLGYCHTFHLQSYTLANGEQKTLMFLDGCPPHLGCTIVLRGASTAELRLVKPILQYMIYAFYHCKLELAFLMDDFALPPPGPEELSLAGFGSSSETTPSTPDKDFMGKIHREKISADKSSQNEHKIEQNDSKSDSPSTSDRGLANLKKVSFEEQRIVEITEAMVESIELNSSINSDDRSPMISPTEESTPSVICQTNKESVDGKEPITGNLYAKSKDSEDQITDSKECHFDDPLHKYQESQDDSIFTSTSVLKEEIRKSSNQFSKVLDDVILSCSPYLKFDTPYLETEPGQKCALRSYFPKEVYWSVHLNPEMSNKRRSRFNTEDGPMSKKTSPYVEMVEPHRFVTETLKESAKSISSQTLMAEFRACGGRIKLLPPDDVKFTPKQNNQKTNKRDSYWERKIDCLDPSNHQRIAVLFSSFSYESLNAPNPCVAPWVVTMEFYGRNDITLGGFLESYCFRDEYKCPNENCETPMTDHIRRFVHQNGCITVILKRLDNPIPGYQNNILLWGWCKKCKQVTPVVPMTLDTWSMSFGKYLDMRFHGKQFGRRASAEPCTHTLHQDHYQYFGHRKIVASFKYSAVHLKEISLPPLEITIKEAQVDHESLARETATLHHCSQNIFSAVVENLCALSAASSLSEFEMKVLSEYKEQLQTEKAQLRELIDDVQHKLLDQHSEADETSQSTHHNGASDTGNQASEMRSEMSDAIVDIKHLIAEAVTSWNTRIQDFIQQQKKLEKLRKETGSSLKAQRDSASSLASDKDSMTVGSENSSVNSPKWQLVDPINKFRPRPEYNQLQFEYAGYSERPELGSESDFDCLEHQLEEAMLEGGLKVPRESDDAIKSISERPPVTVPTITRPDDTKADERNSKHEDIPSVETNSAVVNDANIGATETVHKNESVQGGDHVKDPIDTIVGTDMKSHKIDLDKSKADNDTSECDRTKNCESASQSQTSDVNTSALKDQESSEITQVCGANTQHKANEYVPKMDSEHNTKNEHMHTIDHEPNEARETNKANSANDSIGKAHKANENADMQSDNTEMIEENIKRHINNVTDLKASNVTPFVDNKDTLDGPPIVVNTEASNDDPIVTNEDHFTKTTLHGSNTDEGHLSAEDKGHKRSRSWGESRRSPKPGQVDSNIRRGQEEPVAKQEKKVTMQSLLSNFLTPSTFNLLSSPFPDDEHHLLQPCKKVPIVIYDQEPSSIIAYTLSCHEYDLKLKELQQCLKSQLDNSSLSTKLAKGADTLSLDSGSSNIDNAGDPGKKGVLSFLRGSSTKEKEREKSPIRPGRTPDPDTTVRYVPSHDSGSVDLTDDTDFSFFSASDTDRNRFSRQPQTNLHIELQFSDTSARFYCKVYYAEQFRQLRKLIFPAGEKIFIRSLSRCFDWLARGGKSGSTFCKTLDDRFVLKQMSKLEMQSFLDFAPHYFKYITKAHNEQMPTVLGKIIGVYRIGFRNMQTFNALKQDLLVMENLFYNRKILQIFDLKGSIRNRLVKSTGKKEEELVLLDENLLKLSVDSPLYIRPHSKTVLTLAITNDTQFLSSHLVMDYSLLVGIDEQKKELVVGIIDYIRTFTWDKKLEMIMKSSGILGGQGKLPTVVSPELYRSRFLDAMARYFLLVPDRWTGLGRGVDC